MSIPTKQNRASKRQISGGTVVLLTVICTLFVLLLAYNIWQIASGGAAEAALRQQEMQAYADTVYTNFNAQSEMRDNLRKLERGPGQAKVVAQDAAPDKKIALTIDGMLDEVTMLRLLEILERYNTPATFFVSGMQAAEQPGVVRAISAAQQTIGNYSLHGQPNMENLTQSEMVEELTCANKVIFEITGREPRKFKGNATQYTDALLEAAQACGLSEAVQATTVLTYHSFRSFEETQAFVNRLHYKDILSIKLSGKLEASEYAPKATAQPGAASVPILSTAVESVRPTSQPAEEMGPNERLIRMVEWLMQAMEQTNFSTQAEVLRKMNAGRQIEPAGRLFTSEAGVAYAFYGLGRVDELIGVLASLKAAEGIGTFFVTAQEIEAYPEQIQMLLNNGQAIGIAVYPQKDAEFYAVCHEMLEAKMLLEQHGYRSVRLAMQPYGALGEVIKEACSAMNCTLVAYDFSFNRADNQEAQTVQQVISSVYKQATYGFQRGQVIGMRMNYFERSSLLGELLAELEKTRNPYPIKDIYVLQNSTGYVYTYPLPPEQMLAEVKDRAYPGQLRTSVMDYAKSHYIGNRDVASRAQLPDFTQEEIAMLDTTGRIKNEENAVFLTFDDWGTDFNITKLLNVLDKHKVKATFFVRTEYVPNNPNLLRAIAMAGHEIASHTHTHMPLAHDWQGNWRFEPITEEEANQLEQEMVTSYQVLQEIVGDIRLENGKPALSMVFRPPTMAISRAGMEVVFDTGFTYIVNGSYTTRDYMATNAQRLARDLRSNIRSGSVVIMHMSDNSLYTAEALDLFFTQNEEKSAESAFTFARLSDYLHTDAEP